MLERVDHSEWAAPIVTVPKRNGQVLGLLNYYGRFIPNLTSLIHPLNRLLQHGIAWQWSKACQVAFKAAKNKIVSPNVLMHYDPSHPIRLAADASAYGVGAVISHIMDDGSERPIAFASRTPTPSERNYTQVEKEALSLVFGVCKFHTYLYRWQFTRWSQTISHSPWAWPSRVFERVHIDFAGPFQGAMFLVAVDAYSKWPQVFVMPSTTVTKTIEALRQMFSMYGLPEHIVSDNGPQFTAEEFAVFTKTNGIRHTRSAPYHPATNGLAERFVQSLKHGLKASLSSGLPLMQRLSHFLLTYRISVHLTTGVTPSSLFLKRELRTIFDLLRPDRESHVADRQSHQKSDHDRHSRARHFMSGDLVMAKNYRSGPDWVPATVVARLGPLLETVDKQLWRRHVDQVKKRECSPVLPNTPQHESDGNDWELAGPNLSTSTELTD